MGFENLINQRELMKRYKMSYKKLSRFIKYGVLKEVRLPFDLRSVYYDVEQVEKSLNDLKQFAVKPLEDGKA